MNVKCKNNNLIISDMSDFKLSDIFECGQCFRWVRNEDGSYEGVASLRALKIKQTENEVIFFDTDENDFYGFWYDYFDLGRDYAKIRNDLKSDNDLSDAFGYGPGIRLLKQQLWECIVSFIISASNNIPRIKKIIELFCMNFGEKIMYMGKEYYLFPTPEKTASLTLEDLQIIRAGFRDKYILDAAMKFTTDSDMNFDALSAMDTEEARAALKKINGVGDKVADCVLLFGLGKYDCFPIDVWMKRIMEYCYFGKEPQSIKTIAEYAKNRFGDLRGFAQQYLFFYARENKIGI